MKTQMLRLLAAGALAVSLLAGCGDTGNDTPDSGTPDSGTTTPDSGTPEPDCYENPTTNLQIINSCPPAGTTQITKNPQLPYQSDGSLPALP